MNRPLTARAAPARQAVKALGSRSAITISCQALLETWLPPRIPIISPRGILTEPWARSRRKRKTAIEARKKNIIPCFLN
jgi:hypothetical protein